MARGRTLAAIAAVYVVEGFPMGVFGDLWPVYWVDSGLDDATIGLLSGLGLAWSAKALWSPLVGRYPAYRAWIGAAVAVMGALLLATAYLDPHAAPLLLTGTVGAFCMASATQDIAIDAWTIGLVERGDEGPANAVRITAYRTGMLLSGAALFFLPDRIGWRATHLVAAAMMLALLVVPRAIPTVRLEAVQHDALTALRGLWSRAGAGGVLAFLLLYRLPDFAAGPMIKPFWRRSGIPHEMIGLVSSGVGSVALVLGAALGGWLVTRLGIARALLVVGAAALLSNLGYAAAAATGAAHLAIYGASAIESFSAGLAGAGFMSYLMRICDREHAAVQYATLTALYALVGRLAGMTSGLLVERFGYAPFFALTAVLGLPGLALLPQARRWLEEEGGAS